MTKLYLVQSVRLLCLAAALAGPRIALSSETALRWQRDEGSLALLSGTQTLWQLNFCKSEEKPYFHPLNLADGTTLTALRLPDHPWHRGLWWSWKYINGVNYWEEDKKTGQSRGLTELMNTEVDPAANFSARVKMQILYHLPAQPPVLREARLLDMSAPDAQGNYRIDWSSSFTSGTTDLIFDRTPPKNYSGGYAGLSCRLAAACRGWNFTGSDGVSGAMELYGRNESWMDVSHGGGIAIFDHPSNLRHPSCWYPNMQMPFFSPALLFQWPVTIGPGFTLTLRYRVLVHSAPLDRAALDAEWKRFAAGGS
jgi:hypothetical protein